jgi:hypothetical protein
VTDCWIFICSIISFMSRKTKINLDNDVVVAVLFIAMFPVGMFFGWLIASIFDFLGLP